MAAEAWGSTWRAVHGGIMNSTVVGDKLINIRSCLPVPPPPSGATRQGATSPTLRDCDNCAELDAKEWTRRDRLARQN